MDDPGNLTTFRQHKEKVFTFCVRGTSEGSVWGGADGFYTDDSRLGKAAVHAGLLQAGAEGLVSLIIVPGRAAYKGSTLNGITTSDYGSFSGSFRFSAAVPDDPGTLTKYRNDNNKVLTFRVRGVNEGAVWGGADGHYTDDSRLGRAAVHAGLLKVGEEKLISVIILPGRSAYTGSTQNDVTTNNYGSYHGSFRFAEAIASDPGNLVSFRGKNDQSFTFRVRATSEGSVWGGGDKIYTDDSRLAKAALHAGLLRLGEEGVVTVIILPGRPAYTGSTQNGVTTGNYGSYHGSFRFQ